MMLAAELDDLCQDGKDRVISEIDRFQSFTSGPRSQPLRPYWKARSSQAELDDAERLVCLTELIKVEMRRRSDQGETPTVSEYLQAFPELLDVDARVVSLVYEEFCILEERGEGQDVEAFCNRYPNWRDSLITQIGYHRTLNPKGKPHPRAGDRFEEFQLLRVIGHGKYSQVFLAEDKSLGDKRVVLKVSLDCGREAEAQGALDHPHIVPVNAVVYDDNDLRGLSMPFRPGSSLDRVIRRARLLGTKPRTARDLWDALVDSLDPNLLKDKPPLDIPDGPAGDGWRDFPVNGGFADGVAWIGMVIARTLHFAHQRETFHRDVKPGNVLLTLQHGPQLLDFNLATAPHTPQQAQFAIQGGTAPYMAPEQLAAFLDPKRWKDVGAKADVYSLGLVLWEMLTGEPLDLPDLTLPTSRALRDLLRRRSVLPSEVRRYNDQTPHALEAIVQKCLQYDPARRYASAEDLAEDLERFLKRLPLAHNVNPSRKERTRNWAIRNRKMIGFHVGYLSILALIAPLAFNQVRIWMLGPSEGTPEFNQAAQAIVDKDYAAASEILMTIVAERPSEPLPWVLLTLAADGMESRAEDPSEYFYSKAMSIPGAPMRLHRWMDNAPKELVANFLRFGERSLTRANARIGVHDMKELGRELDVQMELAGHALGHALPHQSQSDDSLSSLHGLATIAEYRNHLEVARGFLDRILTPTSREVRGKAASDRISWRLQRSRVSSKLAAQLAEFDDPEHGRRAIELANDAVNDLDQLASSIPDFLRPYYFSLRTEVHLTRAEIRSQNGLHSLGESDRREAKASLNLWLEYGKSIGEDVSVEIADRYRDRLMKLQDRAVAVTP